MYYLNHRFNKRYSSIICNNVYSIARFYLPDLKIYDNNKGFKLDITREYNEQIKLNYPYYIPFIKHRIVIFETCKYNDNIICRLNNIDHIIKWSEYEIAILIEILNSEIKFIKE